jgi:hypothetical protein
VRSGYYNKPPAGAQVNWGHPLAHGLVFAALFNEGAGARVLSVAGGHAGSLSGAPAWKPTGLEMLAASSQYAEFASVPDGLFLGALSIVWAGTINTGSGFRHFAGKHSGGGGTVNPFDFRTTNDATPALYLLRANTGRVEWQGAGVTLGVPHTCAFSSAAAIEDTSTAFYIDGKPVTTSRLVLTTTGPPTGDGSALRIGRRGDNAVQMDGTVRHLYIWNRQLSAQEQAWIHAEPYALLAPTSPIRRYFIALAAPGDLTGEIAITAPFPQMLAAGTVPIAGDSAITAPFPAMTAEGTVPITGTLAINAPFPSMAADGTVAGAGGTAKWFGLLGIG